MPPTPLTLGVSGAIASLGPEWNPVFNAVRGLQSRREWFEATEEAALPPGVAPYVITLRQEGRPLAVLPMQTGPARQMASMTSPYTVLFRPIIAPGAPLEAIGHAIGKHLRRRPITRLEALDPDCPGLDPFLKGIRHAGLAVYRFDHFGNWRQNIAGMDWQTYLAARPGALRETIRRRSRAVAKDPTIRFEIVTDIAGLPAAIAAYEAVYSRSWKEPEPFPTFNATLLPRLAAMGALRLGVMWQGQTPLAAQYWTVMDSVATVLKLAHVDGAKSLSPGTVLTAHMIEALLTEGGITTLDFGRGDDPYKAGWAPERHQRVGAILANPRRPGGLMEVVRHWAGHTWRKLRPS